MPTLIDSGTTYIELSELLTYWVVAASQRISPDPLSA